MFFLQEFVNLPSDKWPIEMLNNKKCYVKDATEVSPLTAGFCLCTQKLELSTKQVPCRSAAEEVSCE